MIEPSSQSQRICGLFQKDTLLARTPKTEVWAVVDNDGRKYAAKMIKRERDGNGSRNSSFAREFAVFYKLKDGQIEYNSRTNGTTPSGFPNVFFVGNHLTEYDVIVTELFSSDVFSLRNESGLNQDLSTNEYLMLGQDMLFAVMALHEHEFVHRNVKPQNFGIGGGFIPVLVNFSDAKKFTNPRTNKHCSLKQERLFTGTPKYASLNAHRFKIQSRRDDLISLGYSIIDIMNKRLPWDSEAVDQYSFTEKNSYIKHMKENTDLSTLCYGLPACIFRYMRSVIRLSFAETPDYNYLLHMLTS